ncbi:hypothetical protein HNQ77_001551 [Silvibacterium bohemicum]|uniref:Uncharacterized protein n=1 Tax=Silvibacterium bohemicum TaxID=1577686 RepID=A0A841JQD4_9BACT|nr:hypothetical protein [Silvibacterium bohemicum]
MVHYKVTDIGIFVNEEYILRSFPSPRQAANRPRFLFRDVEKP